MKKLIILICNFLSFLRTNFSTNDYIFYSEKLFYKNYYFEFFKALSKQSKKCFLLTSDINEYNDIKKINNQVFYIGDGIIKVVILNIINCDFFFTTMPGIGNNIRKSLKCKNYVYFFHALASTHKIYKDKSFDNFDIIFTNGNYQKIELEERFTKKKIEKKKIVNIGYFYLDFLKNFFQDKNENYILFAPSWNYNKKNLFNDFGIDIIKNLLENNNKVILRPHPEILKRDNHTYKKTISYFNNDENFLLDLNFSNIESLKKSKLIITDNSSIGLEFGLIFYRPTIYIDHKDKIHNSEYNIISSKPLEDKFKEIFGYHVKSDELNQLSSLVEKINYLDNQKINEFREKYLSNFENSVKVAVNYILDQKKI